MKTSYPRAIWLILVVGMITGYSPHLQAQVVFGDCNVVINNRNVSVSGSPVVVVDHSCNQDPRKTLRISYHWLDPTSLSFLLSNAQDGALKELLGDRPLVIQNDTYRFAKELIRNYGVNIDQSSFYRHCYQTCINSPCSYDNEKVQRVENISAGLRKNLRIYDAKERIYLPDFESASVVYSTTQWPSTAIMESST